MLLGKQDVVVIGGGTAGFMVAIGALKLGLKVTLIEKNEQFKDSTLMTGGIPSKAFVHASKVAAKITQADKVGLNARLAAVDLGRINDYVDGVVAQVPKKKKKKAAPKQAKRSTKLEVGERAHAAEQAKQPVQPPEQSTKHVQTANPVKLKFGSRIKIVTAKQVQ